MREGKGFLLFQNIGRSATCRHAGNMNKVRQ